MLEVLLDLVITRLVPKVLKTWSECVAGNLAVLRKMSQDMVNRLYFKSSMRFLAGEEYEKTWIVMAGACLE